jgi:glutamyl-tRNA reductase
MERIGIVGLSLHETDLGGLERLAHPAPDRLDALLRDLADDLGASEAVLIETCNRVEVVYARESGHLPRRTDLELAATRLGLPFCDPLRRRMHFHAGRDAARHLFRVVSSLDSLVVGEDQILAQVRDAFARSERVGLVGRLLGMLFEHAFRVGKLVRRETELSRIPVSVVSLGVLAVLERCGRGARVALVGAGDVAKHVVQSARDHELAIALVANRSLARAATLAARCGARAATLETFLAAPGGFDALISATAAPGFVLCGPALRALADQAPSARGLLAVDLAVPRDVEPLQHPRLELVDLESLRRAADANRAQRTAAAQQAEALVEAKLAQLLQRAAEVSLAEALADVRQESERVFEREMAQLFTGRLAAIGPDERRAIEHWARTAFGRVTHVPIVAMKRVVSDRTLFRAEAVPQEGKR